MINWIIALFYFLEELGFLRIELMITKNLPILLICRVFFCLTYFLKYTKDSTSETDDRTSLFTQKEIIYFGLKQVILILFGMIYLPFAVFISFYSLMMSGRYLTNISEKRKNRLLSIL